jgi:hypothetical protein
MKIKVLIPNGSTIVPCPFQNSGLGLIPSFYHRSSKNSTFELFIDLPIGDWPASHPHKRFKELVLEDIPLAYFTGIS